MSKDEAEHQLLIPDAAKSDPNAQEIIRVWVAHKRQHFTLRVGLWADPAAWGLLLADLARNIARSYEQDAALDPGAALDRIRLAFSAELDSSTDEDEVNGNQ